MGSTDDFPLVPDYPIQETEEDGVLRSRSIGRQEFARLAAPPLRQFPLTFSGRSTADKITLLEWYAKFRTDYFTLTLEDYAVSEAGVYADRVFPVHFSGPPRVSWIGNNQWDIECALVEAPGCALATGDYPDPDDGHPLVAVTGTVSGSDKIFVYAGYGYIYTGSGTLTLDGVAAAATKLDVPLGLHRIYVTGGSGTLEVVP
jgi:hypothetical protein